MNALIVESSRSFRLLVEEALLEAGIFVRSEESAADALQFLERESVDLIVMSLQLADMKGDEFCCRLRDSGNHQHTKVVMFAPLRNKLLLNIAKASGIDHIFERNELEAFKTYLRTLPAQEHSYDELDTLAAYVDQDRRAAEQTIRILKTLGISVDHFDDAEDAYDAVLSNDYDVLLTDINLKEGIDGFELINRLRQLGDSKRLTPILAMSSSKEISHRVGILQCGANDFITKPVLDAELVARIKNLIRSKKLYDEVEKQRQLLERLAMTDKLTGLYNRHFLDRFAIRQIRDAQRHAYPLSLILLDVDHFKLINDSHGHKLGDDVLVALAHLLQSRTRGEDICARFGGEEFVLLLPHCDLQRATQKASELRRSIERLEPHSLPVTASFGVASISDDINNYEQLFIAADQAVYKAKSIGRNCVVCGEDYPDLALDPVATLS